MLYPLSPSGERFVSSVNDIQTRLDRAQKQISSGQKVTAPSDAPDEVSPILQLRAELQRNTDIQSGLNSAQADFNAGESVLSSSVDLLESASTIATQATSITQTAETRNTLAGTVQGLLEQMVLNSRSSANGRYTFSGDADQSPLYQLDLTSATGVARLQQAGATKIVRGPGGWEMQAGLSANDVFDARNPDDSPASGNVFAALNGLRVALLNNDTDAIKASMPALEAASTHLNGQLAFYGRAQNRIVSWLDASKTQDLQLRSQLSGKTDADLTQAITELTQQQTQLQAALSAQARRPRTTLFDLLPE
jgi:flagellar hook-associated protein 3 FlgL